MCGHVECDWLHVEFVVDVDTQDVHFLEMNTRLQVGLQVVW